ncbi:NUDIX hydrolase [Arenimonas sp.]|jgi:8-oxo-dGTP pyrophosphatase MutT (NUDIX family)|uniref:NUDIX hydrolase n=1 Tax=Arenimonas sp. TaxID=1872635 RepID=UPI0037BF28C1
MNDPDHPDEPVYLKLDERRGKALSGRFGEIFTTMTDIRHNFLELLANYPVSGTPETALRQEFLELVSSSADACMRSRLAGHLTGSAWLVSADGRKALLMHHRKLDRWLQPGGHADGDWDLAAVALREAMEETGLPNLHVEPTIFDLDKHRISARGTEPEHWHYDVRFVVRATGSQEFSGNTESWQLRWFDVHDLAQNDGLDESIRRMAHRWLAR